MNNLICIVILVLIISGVIVYYKGRYKPYSQKSNSEKLVSTLQTKINGYIKDLNNGLRSPELIQQCILQELDRYHVNKVNDAKQVLIQIKNCITDLESQQKKIEYSKANLIIKAKDIKSKYNEMKDEKYINQGTVIMSQVSRCDEIIQRIKSKIESTNNQANKIMDSIDTFEIEFDMKKTDINLQFSDYLTNISLNPSFRFDLNLNDLEIEFKYKINELSVKAEVDSKLIKPSDNIIADLEVTDNDKQKFLEL